MRYFCITLILLFSSFINAQQAINLETVKVFNPTQESKAINDAYTENMFFGIFGVKHLINALNIDLKGVKEVTVTSNANPKIKDPVYKAVYNEDGTLSVFEISSQIGKALQTTYTYKDGVIETEKIHYQNQSPIVNNFYYNQNKMVIIKDDRTEIVTLDRDLLLKKVYTDNKLAIEDRVMHNCRITKSYGKDIGKLCFNDINFKVPLVITDYVPEVDQKNLNVTLNKGDVSEINLIGEKTYAIKLQGKEKFQLVLDSQNRIKRFNYLGNLARKEQPIEFKFAYTMYK